MKELDDKEKKIVNNIVEFTEKKQNEQNNIVNIIYHSLSKKIRYNKQEQRIWIENEKKYPNDSIISISDNVVPIAKIISFLKYLKETNFTAFVEYFSENMLNDTSTIDHSDDNGWQEIIDVEIKDFFFKYLYCGIFATHHLINYRGKEGDENEYKTIEQIRHEDEIKTMYKEIKWARRAVRIAIVSIIVSAAISIISIIVVATDIKFSLS